MLASIRPIRLRCEYFENPLGVDDPQPRLSWQLTSDRIGARQTSYQILAASSLTELGQNASDLWDSGRVFSSDPIHIPYAGKPLGSLTRAWWKVRTWDEDGVLSDWSEPAFWETGLFSNDDWVGDWIQDLPLGGPRTSAPAGFFRKEVLIERPVARARLVATALGLYEFRLNGRRVGDHELAPGWTDYRQRVPYQVYDVTAMLAEGANTLAAILGDGWYCGHVELGGRQRYGDRARLRAQLHVEYVGGGRRVFATDESWKVAFGPILESDLLMGESYDARQEKPGWDGGDFCDCDWRNVIPAEISIACSGLLGPPVRIQEVLLPVKPPVKVSQWPPHEYLFDFGQNLVGRARLRVKGSAGRTVTLRFGEMLDGQGKLYTANLRGAAQTDHYTLRGDPDGETWEPRFTLHGFRYVQVAGLDSPPTTETLTAVVIHSDLPKMGTFECSDPLVNRLQQNIDWSLRGNFVDIPTDCPQRNERLGWTGDAQLIARAAGFNRQVAPFFRKWLKDLREAQGPEGHLPPYAPNTGAVEHEGGPAWEDADIIVPWAMYQTFGDPSFLREQYASMKAYLASVERDAIGYIRSHPDFSGFKGFGDWLSVGADTPLDLVGTAYFAQAARLMTKIAIVLEESEDVERFARLGESIRAAFRKRFVSSNGVIGTGTQTAYVLALHFDLLTSYQRIRALDRLVDDIVARDYHLSTGILGSAYLLRVLSNHGHLEVAYRLLLQTSYPGWLYPVTQGATTIWERWDGWTPEKGFQDPTMNSFNHYMFGAVGQWLYTVVAGIDIDELHPGYEHVVLRPRIGGGLKFAKAGYVSVRGRIESHWRYEHGWVTWNVEVPPGVTATAYVPCRPGTEVQASPGARYQRHVADAALYKLPSGRFFFRSRVDRAT